MEDKLNLPLRKAWLKSPEPGNVTENYQSQCHGLEGELEVFLFSVG